MNNKMRKKRYDEIEEAEINQRKYEKKINPTFLIIGPFYYFFFGLWKSGFALMLILIGLPVMQLVLIDLPSIVQAIETKESLNLEWYRPSNLFVLSISIAVIIYKSMMVDLEIYNKEKYNITKWF